MRKRRYIAIFMALIFICGCSDKQVNDTKAGSENTIDTNDIEDRTEVESGDIKDESDIDTSDIKDESDIDTSDVKDESDIDTSDIKGGIGNDVSDSESSDNIDLTQLTSTMVYAEVYNMMLDPESYVGKKIKMQGQLAVYEAPEDYEFGSGYYFAVVIADATACCQQGIEFVLSDTSLEYPKDYPAENSEITVSGEFQIYQEGDYKYCHLVNAVIE